MITKQSEKKRYCDRTASENEIISGKRRIKLRAVSIMDL